MTGRPRNPEREAARKSGARHYESGLACRHGHGAGLRYTSTGACVRCANRHAPDQQARND